MQQEITAAKNSGVEASGAAVSTPTLPPRNALTYWVLFKECFLMSLTTFGGGLVIMAIMQKKFTEDYHWFTEDEIMDMIAIAQSCPGVMCVNSSLIIGYRIGGVPGMLLTGFGTILPPMIILSIISVFYQQFRSNKIVSLVFHGMQAGVVAVIASALITMVKNVLSSRNALTIPLIALASIAAVIFRVDVIYLILACGLIGGVMTVVQDRRQHTQEGGAQS